MDCRSVNRCDEISICAHYYDLVHFVEKTEEKRAIVL